MKKLIILSIFLAGSAWASADIWRVNNVPGIARDFDNISDAVAAAESGDTIHVEGSITPYNETVNINKKLFIGGPGFYLTDNPQTQHIKLSAKITVINFEDGSAGSVLAGIEQIAATGNKISIADSEIKIINGKLFAVEIDNSEKPLNNIDVRKSWLDGGTIRSLGSTEVTNLNITNNFFGNTATNTIILHEGIKAFISNNTFYGQFTVSSQNTGTSIANNVFFRTSGTAVLTVSGADRCVRNLYNVSGLGGMVDNINFNRLDNQAVTVWFSCAGANPALDKYFTAAVNSPLISAASQGQQLGMFGGLAPYELSGLTNIPAVYEIIMPNEVSADGFDVTVKVKAH